MIKKRILQISKYYPPSLGGTERFCQYLSEGIAGKYASDYEVKVICFGETGKKKIEIINGITIYRSGLLANIFRQPISFSYFRMLRRIIKEWEPDLIHFHLPNPLVMAILLPMLPKRTKLYLHWHQDITAQSHMYSLIKHLEKRLLERADKVVTSSLNYKLFSVPLQPFLRKVDVFPSAIDENMLLLKNQDVCKIAAIREKNRGKKMILFVGRHVIHKGAQLLIEAAQYVKNECVIYIIGAGPMTKSLKRQCKQGNVIFPGCVNDEELKHYYYAADIFAFPSYTRSEAFGLALAEAMYCGAVPVTFTIEGSGVNWVCLDKVTGIEVEKCNVEEYAKALDTLIADDTLREEYARKGKERICNEFTLEKRIDMLANQYASLLNSQDDEVR